MGPPVHKMTINTWEPFKPGGATEAVFRVKLLAQGPSQGGAI